MTFCKLREIEYFDLELKETRVFKCNEPAEENGYCIYHVGYEDFKLYDLHKDTIRSRLQVKINDCIQTKKTLYLIAYFLPTVHFNTTFHKPVYFNLAKFLGYVDCSKAQFLAGVDFSGVEFNKETLFIRSDFHIHARQNSRTECRSLMRHFTAKQSFHFLSSTERLSLFPVDSLAKCRFLILNLKVW
jgi:hypothetical protein